MKKTLKTSPDKLNYAFTTMVSTETIAKVQKNIIVHKVVSPERRLSILTAVEGSGTAGVHGVHGGAAQFFVEVQTNLVTGCNNNQLHL